MHSTENSREIESFVQKVESALEVGFEEVFSDETRKTQKILLGVSFILILITWNAIEFAGQVQIAGLQFIGLTAREIVLLSGSLICLYFEVLLATRSYSEWNLWRLKSRVGEITADSIREEVSDLREKMLESVVRIMPKPEWESKPKWRLKVGKKNFFGAWYGSRKKYNCDYFSLDEEGKEAFDRIQQLGQQYGWFESVLKSYSLSRRYRLLTEAMFPLIFGAASIIMSIVIFFSE